MSINVTNCDFAKFYLCVIFCDQVQIYLYVKSILKKYLKVKIMKYTKEISVKSAMLSRTSCGPQNYIYMS